MKRTTSITFFFLHSSHYCLFIGTFHTMTSNLVANPPPPPRKTPTPHFNTHRSEFPPVVNGSCSAPSIVGSSTSAAARYRHWRVLSSFSAYQSPIASTHRIHNGTETSGSHRKGAGSPRKHRTENGGSDGAPVYSQSNDDMHLDHHGEGNDSTAEEQHAVPSTGNDPTQRFTASRQGASPPPTPRPHLPTLYPRCTAAGCSSPRHHPATTARSGITIAVNDRQFQSQPLMYFEAKEYRSTMFRQGLPCVVAKKPLVWSVTPRVDSHRSTNEVK